MSEHLQSSASNDRRFGPNLVRSWFDTVVNPLINALRGESRYLELKDWSWNEYSGTFDFIRPIYGYLDHEVHANADQFFNLFGVFKVFIDEHDNALNDLAEKCQGLGSALESSPSFIELMDRIIEMANHDGNNPRIATRVEDGEPMFHDRSALIGYTVNHRGVLPGYYVLSGVWNDHGRKLIQLMQSEEFEEEYNALISSGQSLKSFCTSFEAALEDKRNELSMMVDEPIVKKVA